MFLQTLEKVKSQPFLSQYFDCWQDRTDCFLVLRYEKNGSLSGKLDGGVPLHLVARRITAQILLALQFLHDSLGIVHCDVKPDNILIDENHQAVLSDFGIVRCLNEELKGEWGTPTYLVSFKFSSLVFMY